MIDPCIANIEVKPYAISSVSTDNTIRLNAVNDLAARVGGDAKYGITPNMTADFTVNTDFAQVEADEQQVNLTRFNLFFPEKRDFFLEGQGTFAFAGASAGSMPAPATRRICSSAGASGWTPAASIPIQAGGRLTGKAGKFSIRRAERTDCQ